jgi:hypothetical protein
MMVIEPPRPTLAPPLAFALAPRPPSDTVALPDKLTRARLSGRPESAATTVPEILPDPSGICRTRPWLGSRADPL